MEFTLIGDAVNRASRFCDAAAPGEVLISPDLHQRVWKMVRTSPRSIQTKHEGDWPAFQLLACLEKSGSTGVKSDSIEMQLPASSSSSGPTGSAQ